MKPINRKLRIITVTAIAWIALGLMTSPELSAQSNSVSYFTINDIGSPKPWKPGEVTVGESIDGVQITARDANGDIVTGFNSQVFLSERTDYGDGRIAPEVIQLNNGVWNGTIRIFRAGLKKSSFQVVGDVWIQATDNASNPHFGTSNVFTARPESFDRLLVVLPGESFFPGSLTGRSGNAFSQQTGEEFTLTVLATDRYWNKKRDENDNVHLISTDENAVLPANKDMVDGEVFLKVTLNTAGTQTVTAFDIDNQVTISPHTSSNISVLAGPPGPVVEYDFNAISSPQVAGDSVAVTIRAIDGAGHTVANFTGQANVTSSTGPGTIQGGNVIFSNGIWSGSVVLTKAAPNVRLSVQDFNNTTGESDPFNIIAGEAARLQILLSGETATPGLAPGKNGQPLKQLAGQAFNAEVRSTDSWWNVTAAGNLSLQFSSSDPQATLPQNTTQSTSQATYSFTFLREGQNHINVQESNNPKLDETYTSNQFYVDTGEIAGFRISTIGSTQTAGKSFPVQIEAIDDEGNPVTTYNDDVILFATTGNGTISNTGVTLNNGFWQGDLYVTRADTEVVIHVADFVPPPNTHSGSSNMFVVQPDTVAGLQVLFPGQTATPGVVPGWTGTPLTQTAGDSLDFTLRAVDQYWNLIPNYSDEVEFTSSDTFAVFPDTVTLANGEIQLRLTLRAAGNQHLTAASLQGGLPSAVSEAVTVQPDVFTQLVLTLPGESVLRGDTESDPNRSPGRAGAVVPQTSGLPFTVHVYAVDNYFNPVETAPADQISLFVTDNSAIVSPSNTMLTQGHTQFSVTINQGGSQVLRANDITDTNIAQSLEGVVSIILGGLHYEVAFDNSEVTAGETFTVHVFFKNGIGENIASANHLVHLTAVSSVDLEQEIGTLDIVSFNLQAGQRTVNQAFDTAGLIRIKVTDDAGTEPGFSEPLQVLAGTVSTLDISAGKLEVGGAEETNISVTVRDAAGNRISNEVVTFTLISGTGRLSSNSATSNTNGVAGVVFTAGAITETNRVRAAVDSITSDIEIVVNLTKSDLADGVVINYPNPFGVEHPSTSIDYYLSDNADVTLKIFDLFGNLVWSADFSSGQDGGMGRGQSIHPNSVQWDGRNDNGQKVASGGYILLAKGVVDGKVVMETKRKIVVVR